MIHSDNLFFTIVKQLISNIKSTIKHDITFGDEVENQRRISLMEKPIWKVDWESIN